MPGSNITCQGLSSAYNSPYIATNNRYNNNQFSGLTIENNTLVVQSPATNFPFATGDIVYFTPAGYSGDFIVPPTIYYAIVISPTQMRLATTLQNAQEGIFVTLDSSNSSNFGIDNGTFLQKVVSNSRIYHSVPNSFPNNSHLNKSEWLSSAYSSQVFFLQNKIRIDFTLNGSGVVAGIATTSTTSNIPNYAISVGRGNIETSDLNARMVMIMESTGASYLPTFASSSKRAVTPNGINSMRITINSGVISVAYLSGGSYITAYATVPLSDTTPCRFFSFNSINGTGLTDCTITYF